MSFGAIWLLPRGMVVFFSLDVLKQKAGQLAVKDALIWVFTWSKILDLIAQMAPCLFYDSVW